MTVFSRLLPRRYRVDPEEVAEVAAILRDASRGDDIEVLRAVAVELRAQIEATAKPWILTAVDGVIAECMPPRPFPAEESDPVSAQVESGSEYENGTTRGPCSSEV